MQETLFPSQAKFYNREYYFESDEISLTEKLNQLVKTHPRVTFGSYPAWSNQYYRTKAGHHVRVKIYKSKGFVQLL